MIVDTAGFSSAGKIVFANVENGIRKARGKRKKKKKKTRRTDREETRQGPGSDKVSKWRCLVCRDGSVPSQFLYMCLSRSLLYGTGDVVQLKDKTY